VKYIIKSAEPECFSNWKNLAGEDWTPTYADLQNPQKKEVHCALIREQGYICCYCQSRIDRSTSHIEHFRPQASHPMDRLDYRNFLASCNCGERHAGLSECDDPPLECEVEELPTTRAMHCGKFKRDSYGIGLVSPLEPDCESYFRYGELTGMINPAPDPTKRDRASTTIDVLALNNTYLTRRRKEAFDGALYDLDSLPPEEGRKLIDGFGDRDEHGRFAPFCAAIVSVLNQYFPAQ